MSDTKVWAKMIGQATFLGSLQASIASVEMSSKFSVKNFSTNQETLNNAAEALRGYLYVAVVWTLATMLVMYGQYDMPGAIYGFICNAIYIIWVYFSYKQAFTDAATKNNLQQPVVFWN